MFWWALVAFLIFAALICCLPSWLTRDGFPDFSDKGQIGDTIGGIMGPFVAIAAAGLTFIAFWVQYKANIQQRNDIALERFERNFFEMLHIQQEITNGLLIEELSSDGHQVRAQRGRDVFQFVYETGKDRIKVGDTTSLMTLKYALSQSDDVKKEIISIRNLWFLDHYFRHLYRIFKYIDEYDDIEGLDRQQYACIARATLSPYEIVMLFYIGFCHPRFKLLMEKYELLQNIRTGLLASTEDQDLYRRKMTSQYKSADDDSRDMSLEYKKSAFTKVL